MGERIRNLLQRKVAFAAVVAAVVALSGGLAVAHLESRTAVKPAPPHKQSAASLKTPVPTAAKTPQRAATAAKPTAAPCNIQIHTTDPNAHISKTCSSSNGSGTASVNNHTSTSGASSNMSVSNVSSQSSSSGGSNYSHSETNVTINNN